MGKSLKQMLESEIKKSGINEKDLDMKNIFIDIVNTDYINKKAIAS